MPRGTEGHTGRGEAGRGGERRGDAGSREVSEGVEGGVGTARLEAVTARAPRSHPAAASGRDPRPGREERRHSGRRSPRPLRLRIHYTSVSHFGITLSASRSVERG